MKRKGKSRVRPKPVPEVIVEDEKSNPKEKIEKKRPSKSFVSIGSNMGDRAANLQKAVAMISKVIGRITLESSVYETSPWGKTDQDPFYNQVISVKTTLKPLEMLRSLQYIERKMGRVRKEENGPRIIDLDILTFAKVKMETGNLTIPHPEMKNRLFVLVPLMEIAPEFVHPGTKQRIDDLFINCQDRGDVVLL